MIRLKDLLLEKMTFNQLMSVSDKNRISRSKSMNVKSLRIVSSKDGESWTFSYKSNPSTTGQRHQGYIKFLKGELKSGKSADDMECIVDCTCPDFKYRYAYNDAKKGASITGNKSWNKNNGQTPLPINRNVGLCKHLIALARYLNTKINTKRGLKESIAPSVLDELTNECNNKILVVEGVLIDYIKKRLAFLEKRIPELENEYDKLEDKSMNTYRVRKELYAARKELANLKNIEL
jgi:hypothetical protein